MAYPHPVDPPHIPTQNPMGVYERDFVINDTDRISYIVFEGVSSCLELYINNVYVGFSRGSHMQAEFNISKYVHKGSNTVCVKVKKWCVGSYLEDQDFSDFTVYSEMYMYCRALRSILKI